MKKQKKKISGEKEDVKQTTKNEKIVISAPREPITTLPGVVNDVEIQTPAETAREIAPPTEKPKVDLFSKEFCGELWGLMFDRIAATKGEHWKLREAEKKTLGETTSNVANRYVGEVLGEHPELAALVISVAVVTIPRMMEDGRIKRKTGQVVIGADRAPGLEQEPSIRDSAAIQEPASSISKDKP
jgi:hypothetical protein